MTIISVKEYWRKQANILPKLATMLDKDFADICPDTGPLRGAADMCRTGLGREHYFYSMTALKFCIKSEGHIPSHAPETVEIFLSVTAGSNKKIDDHDPFNRLEFDVVLKAVKGKTFLGAWHLDRHVGEEPTKDIHPLYHFHFGGRHLGELGDDVGRMLITEAPRLPHYPMDAVLGVDYVLSHYAGETWAKLKDDSTYSNFLKPSQDFLMASYARSLNTYFGTQPDERINGGACYLWPNLPPHEHPDV
ncbi:hypothetical protein [Pseudodesulfovibrio karagichevae]|uniref:Uncharacterized protein n=1 Tax=Pseudodesulfovibrio karagichevae TaxID=3239305 RepID=A0ABV4K6N3_9BACT